MDDELKVVLTLSLIAFIAVVIIAPREGDKPSMDAVSTVRRDLSTPSPPRKFCEKFLGPPLHEQSYTAEHSEAYEGLSRCWPALEM